MYRGPKSLGLQGLQRTVAEGAMGAVGQLVASPRERAAESYEIKVGCTKMWQDYEWIDRKSEYDMTPINCVYNTGIDAYLIV